MMTLEEIKSNRDLLNKIDWNMTPEKAVEMYLEWGTGWVRGNDFVSHDNSESFYFVLFDWEEPHAVTLIHRTMDGAEELAKIKVPEELFQQAWHEDGIRPGGSVHRLNRELQEWVCKTIGGPPILTEPQTHH